jgi:hypothetical protein
MTRALLLVLLAAAPLHAGLWDRDRPVTLPDHFDTATGKFDRPPEDYYRRREARLRPLLDALPDAPSAADAERVADALPLFDDAVVAALRCGEVSRAMALLERENRLIAGIRGSLTARAADATARANANEAACLLARWHEGRRAEDLHGAVELLQGVLAADKYNLDAQWSLTETNWLLGAPAWHANAEPVFPNLLGLRDASFRGGLDDNAPARVGVAGCLNFLVRRIVYESGWHDVDVMYAYSLALALTGRETEALFAWFRVAELIDSGAATVVSGAPAGTALKRLLGKHLETVEGREEAERLYAELRRKTDEWHERRLQYTRTQLEAGRHPDTHPDFWAAWDAVPPSPPAEMETDPAVSTTLLVGGLGGLMVVLLLILGFSVFLGRKTAPPPKIDEL